MNDSSLQSLLGIARKLERAVVAARESQAARSSRGTTARLGPSAEPNPEIVEAFEKLTTAPDGESLFQSFMDGLMTISTADRGFILLLEEGRKVRFKTGVNIDASFLSKVENKCGMEAINRVLRSRQLENLDDASNGIEVPGRAVICLPIIYGERYEDPQLGGAVYLERSGAPFPRRIANHVKSLTRLATLAIESFHLNTELSQVDGEASHYKRNLAKLLEVSRKISAILDVDELLGLIVDKALEVTMASRGYIMIMDKTTRELVFKVGRSWNRKLDEKRKSISLKEDQFFFSKTITGRAISERKPICLTDALGGDSQDVSVSIMTMELQSVMCAPLLDGEDVLGLVYVDSQAKTQEFGQSDLELFEGLAGQAAIALKNAMLYQAVGEQQRLAGELDIAARMQEDLLPKTIPKVRGLELAGLMVPAKEVGGDYFDYIPDEDRPNEALSIVVGDVSGKGLGAGMVAVMARCHLRTMLRAYGCQSPNSILSYLNTILAADTKPGQFMTMLLAAWDPDRSALRYSSAGHEQIIHWRAATRRAEAFVSGGTPLALLSAARCTEDRELVIAPGDMVLLYTDGVTEAMNEASEEYSLEMLMEVVHKHGHETPQVLLDTIMKELNRYRGKAEQSDDITLVAIKRV
jgi:sigma-B regulation protein RsbU (phosphoserine phosphatase)